MKQIKPYIHYLYEAAVQNVNTDINFACRIYKKAHKKSPETIREDFCGTAKLACNWVQRNKNNKAWGIDIHQPTLNWGLKNNAKPLSTEERQRLHLICANVLEAREQLVDLIFALNFSFCIFKERVKLKKYFKNVYNSLCKDGLFIIDIYGGTESITAKSDETRQIPGFTTDEGVHIPDFEYEWEQASFNPINHHTTCHIHFNIPGKGDIKKAFSYAWRLWTLPELQEILLESGFSSADVYLHGFTDEGESDEIFRKRTNYENAEGWVAYIVGIK